MRRNSGNFLMIVLSLVLGLPSFSQVPEGRQLFTVNCSVCHTIGAGKLIGPDLAGLEQRREREWVFRFIRSSQSMINSGDTEAVKVFEAYDKMIMPDQAALSDEQIEAILLYIGRPGSKAGISEDFEPDAEPLDAELRPMVSYNDRELEKINEGRDLFTGNAKLSSGGPACISCHNVTEQNEFSGGNLAPDLTDVYSRIDEDMIIQLATAPKYPSMQKAYDGRPITSAEASALVSYFRYAGTASPHQQERNQRAADFLNRLKSSEK